MYPFTMTKKPVNFLEIKLIGLRAAYVTPDAMHDRVSLTDYTFCNSTVSVGFSEAYIFKLYNCCTLLMAYGNVLVIALYAVIN